jgi:hypothetical protein
MRAYWLLPADRDLPTTISQRVPPVRFPGRAGLRIDQVGPGAWAAVALAKRMERTASSGAAKAHSDKRMGWRRCSDHGWCAHPKKQNHFPVAAPHPQGDRDPIRARRKRRAYFFFRRTVDGRSNPPGGPPSGSATTGARRGPSLFPSWARLSRTKRKRPPDRANWAGVGRPIRHDCCNLDPQVGHLHCSKGHCPKGQVGVEGLSRPTRAAL